MDAAGLYVTGPFFDQDTSPIFHHPFVYEVSPDGGSFSINNKMKLSDPVFYDTSKKCLTELFDYLNCNMEIGEEVELCSLWAFGLDRFTEPPLKELDLEIDLSSFQLGNEFEWKNRQYIRVRK